MAESGDNALTLPVEEMQTAPLYVPGTLIPSPVSAVTDPETLSAVGFELPPLT